VNTSGPIVCDACGYITADDVATCPRCNAAMPRPEAWPADPAAVGHGYDQAAAGRQTRPPLPTERAPYGPPAVARRRRSYVVPVAIVVGVLVVAAAAFLLGVVPRIASGLGGLVEDAQAKAELEEALRGQPNFTAQFDAVEGTLAFSGTLTRRGDDLAVTMYYPRALLLDDPRREGKAEIGVILPAAGAATVMMPEMQGYLKVPPGSEDFPDNWFVRVEKIVAEPACRVRRAPAVTLNGIPCKVYSLSASNRSEGSAFVYVGEEPKNVLMKVELGREWTAVGDLKLSLRNPSLKIDEDMFRIPVTFSELNPGKKK
jgi:hypothetical protein